MVLALDGSQSQLVASTRSKASALQRAASSSCTPGHSSDTAWTQHKHRHSSDTLEHSSDIALTVGYTSETTGHSWTQPTMTSAGLRGEHRLADVSGVPHSPGVRGWLESCGQARVRQLTGAASGPSVGWHHGSTASSSPIHTPGTARGQRTPDLAQTSSSCLAHTRHASVH